MCTCYFFPGCYCPHNEDEEALKASAVVGTSPKSVLFQIQALSPSDKGKDSDVLNQLSSPFKPRVPVIKVRIQMS